MDMFGSSLAAIKDPRTISRCALLIAVNVVLSFFKIQLSPHIIISFSFLAVAVIAYLYGPVIAGLCAGLCDMVSFFVKPTGAFNPAFTLVAVVGGVIFGLFLHNAEVNPFRAFFCKLTVNLVVHLFLNTLMISVFYSMPFWVALPPRLLKNVIMLPLETAAIYFAIKVIDRVIIKKTAE